MIKPEPDYIVQVILENFDKHFALFDSVTTAARDRFVNAKWSACQRASRERIKLYDLRVSETLEELRGRFAIRKADPQLWQKVRHAYALALKTHKRPELAETFYNSVFCHLFHRNYFNNRQIFVDSTVSWLPEPDAHEPPLFWHGDLAERGICHTFASVIDSLSPGLPVRSPLSAMRWLLRSLRSQTSLRLAELRQCRLTVYRQLFYRNKAAYIIGRLQNDWHSWPVVIPLINNDKGEILVDALICDCDQLAILFGFARSSFMVRCPVPSRLIDFLMRLMPTKSRADLYMAIGLHKQAKNEFYRGFLHQLATSEDQLVIAPGTRGMVMSVFTLPSWPYVFKLIKDKFEPPKQWTRQQVKDKYLLVKLHDRVGRMADTLEFSDVAFPRERISDDLLKELRQVAPSQLQEEEDKVVIRHLYVERRMQPLNLYLEQANEQQKIRALNEYGLALKQLAAANIFPGDMLLKNFGVTRHGRVIFYDYDEISYMTECHFRPKPKPRTYEEEMAHEPWYAVMPGDIFPEEIFCFVTPRKAERDVLLKLHPELVEPDFWQQMQQKIHRGIFDDVIPYDEKFRLKHFRYDSNPSNTTAGDSPQRAVLPVS